MPSGFAGLGKTFIVIGLIIVLMGVIMSVWPRMPWLGRLPGDMLIQREHSTFYFPITTCLVVSLVLSLLLWIGGRWR